MSDVIQEASLTWKVTPEMLSVLRRDGTFQAVNPAWEKTMGWRRDEMIDKSYMEFIHPGDLEAAQVSLATINEGTPVLKLNNRVRAAGGSYHWLQWVAVPEGDLIVCTARDVTEDRHNVEVIEQQKDEASLREQFLAVLGHDLRNPLAAIRSGTSILSRRVEDTTHAEILTGMRQSAGRMSELIENMMDFARVRLGSGIGLDREAVTDLSEPIERIVNELRQSAADQGFEISQRANGMVKLDLPRFEQVLSNLLGNAVTHGDSSQPIRIDSAIAEDGLTLSICNAGTPISAVARKHLFKPFLRDEVQRSQQGLGLGLYISSEIVRAHGGRLDVTSDETETCFIVHIP